MAFHRPVLIGDEVTCYATIRRIGRTSITIAVETWARRHNQQALTKVTEGVFTYVAIGSDRRPRSVDSPP